MAPSICFWPYFLHWYPSKSGTDVTRNVPCCFFLQRSSWSDPLDDRDQISFCSHLNRSAYLLLMQLRLLDSSTCCSPLFRTLLMLPWRRRLLVVVSGRPPPSTLTDDGHAPLLRFGKSSSRSCATSSSSRPISRVIGARISSFLLGK
jgi:hypothetical protein